jgi:phosphoribosylanthranilate isomerase
VTELSAFNALGFDFFQVHFRHDLPPATVASWAETVGVERLWLAPKLPPEVEMPGALLPLAKHFLLDTFHADKFGGTGATGDWAKFARQQTAHADKTWILSGGLNPDNIGEAVRASGARFVDVNSGVESAPGVKDQEKLKRFVIALHKARTETTA